MEPLAWSRLDTGVLAAYITSPKLSIKAVASKYASTASANEAISFRLAFTAIRLRGGMQNLQQGQQGQALDPGDLNKLNAVSVYDCIPREHFRQEWFKPFINALGTKTQDGFTQGDQGADCE